MYGSIHGFSLYKYNDVSYTSSQTKTMNKKNIYVYCTKL